MCCLLKKRQKEYLKRKRGGAGEKDLLDLFWLTGKHHQHLRMCDSVRCCKNTLQTISSRCLHPSPSVFVYLCSIFMFFLHYKRICNRKDENNKYLVIKRNNVILCKTHHNTEKSEVSSSYRKTSLH